MDVVTHAAMGTVIASPFFAEYPLPAAGFMLGSAIPDLDALSRFFGKRVFLKWHQTYTHSLPLIALATAIGWFVVRLYVRSFDRQSWRWESPWCCTLFWISPKALLVHDGLLRQPTTVILPG